MSQGLGVLASQLVAPRHFEKNVKELEPAEEPAASLQLSSSDFDAMLLAPHACAKMHQINF